MRTKDIDLVLPCFNPLDNWVETACDRIDELRSSLTDYTFHCYVVNDGSTRNVTDEHVQRLKARIPEVNWISYETNRGKGYALRQGVSSTSSDTVIYTDIDLPYQMHSMLECLESVLNGEANVCVAVRNASYYELLPTRRRYLSKALRWVNKSMLGLKTSDTQGGLKVFDRKGREHFLATTIDRYLFDLEFVYLCSKDKSISIKAIESDMREDIEFSKVPLSILRREATNFLKLVLFRR